MIRSRHTSHRAILTASIGALLGWVGSAPAQTVFWDPSGDGNSAIGGTGTWNLTPLWDPTGTDLLADNVSWPNNDTAVGIFGGTGGVVTINTGTGVTVNSLVFNVPGYTIGSAAAADVLTMAGATPSVNVTIGTHSARINSIIAGTAGLNVLGAGTLVLGGANTYTGQTLVANGATLSLGAAAALGAAGVGNETVVGAGATLNVGGQAVSNNPAPGAVVEIIRIAGSGVGDGGALINSGASQQNALGKVVLTANATVNAGAGISTSYNAGGQIVTSAGGRFDIRLNAAPTAGQAHLDLGGFSLTKIGTHLFALVNADVTAGNIIVNEGQLNLEAGTLVPAGGTITVNPNGKLGFFSVTAAGNIARQIVVNGGTIGDPTSTGAAQTVGAPIQFTGALNPNFSAISTNRTTLSGVISQNAFTGTALEKRGPGLLTFSNTANTFSAPITVLGGTLGADFTTTLSGGVPTAPPVISTDTPLGTNGVITLAGGTLAIRANMADDATNQVFDLQRQIVVDRAPSGMTFARIGNANQIDKHVRITSLTFAPPSAANGFSIGQNQFNFAQVNTHRLEIPLMTMSGDTVMANGDHTFTGNIVSANRNSLGHSGGSTLQFIAPGTHGFNAFFNLAGSIRVGSGFGTPITSDTVTVGTGTVYIAPGAGGSWRGSGNLAPGQVVDATLSQVLNIPGVNFGGVTQVPSNLRALGTGVYGVGGATYGDIDLRSVGDGTWRIGSGIAGAGNGTITGRISGTRGNVVRVGGGTGTVTSTGTDAISGNAFLEVGSALLNNAATSFGTGTFVLTGTNNFTGGTQVNRGSTLAFQNIGALGSGPVAAFGVLTAQGAGGTFTANGSTNAFTPTLHAGSTLSLNNGAVTGNADINRWGDTAPVVLNASTLTFTSRNDNASTSTEQIGDLSFAGGSILNVNRQNAVTGNIAQLFVTSLTRVGTGTLEAVRTTGTGAGWGGGQLFRVNGTVPTVVNDMISPWLMQQNNGVVEFTTLGVNGIVPATYNATVATGTYAAGTLNYDGATGGKIDVTTAALTLTDDPILYALRTNQAINVSGVNDTIAIRSGGLIGNATTGTTTVAPALVFNNGTQNIEALVNSRNGGNLNLTGAVTAAGFTKFGVGIVSLNAANPNLSGVISVNQGTLQLHGPTATGTHNVAGTAQIQLRGGQLNLRSNNSAVTGTINPTLQTGILVAANIPTATIDLNRSGADTASSGTFIFNPAAASPGLVLQGAPGAQGQTLNISGANYALQFLTNSQNSFEGNITINNAVNLTLNNAPTYTGTNPVITKSGAGNWIIGVSAGSPSASPNMQVQLNGGTLEMRSVLSFGQGAVGGTRLNLNSGTLNLRRDSAGTYGGLSSSLAYSVSINGNVTLSTDRVGGTATNFAEGLGTMTINGSPTLTANNGNGIYPDIFGIEGGVSMRINGVALLASNVVPVGGGSLDSSLRLREAVIGGGIVKLGTGHLHLLSSANTYSGGTYVNQGVLRARAANALGTGPVYLNPGATIDFNSSSNLAFGQAMFVRGSGAFLPMISVSASGLVHPFVNTVNAPQGVVGLSNGTGGSYDEVIDLSVMYGGGWSLGGISTAAYDPVYTAPALIAGNDNLYRLGGGGTAFAMGTDSSRAPRANVLTGANNVRLGFDSVNIMPVNHTNFQYSIAGINDYTGGSTVIHRGMVARLFSANNGVRSGFSDSAVDVFGVLGLGGMATLDKGDGHVNAVTFHPGSGLFLDNTNGAANNVGEFAAANVGNRWNDTVPIALNGAVLNLIGLNEGSSAETVGDVTYSRGARIRSGRTNAATTPTLTATSTLTINSVTRSGPGSTLMLQSAAAGSLNAATNFDRIIVTNAPTPLNGMVAPHIVNGTDHTFVTHGANGFTNVTFDNSVTASPIPAGLGANAKVEVNAGAGVALSDNPVIYALRTNRDINLGGPSNTLTLRSGGLIGHANTLSINPHLVFNDGTANIEALIYNSSTVNINGTITANGVTKFGAGNLSINVPQRNYASGWTVNSGTLQINDLEGLGQSVPANAVTLNASMATGGLATQAFAITNLTFTRNQGTPELQTFTGGPITVVNEATIRVSAGDDRNLQIPAVTLDSTSTASSVAFTFDVPNNRFRGTIPNVTLNDDATIRVFDNGAPTDTGRATAGVFTQFTAADKDVVKIGNRTLELPNDNSTSFTGGSITVSQGSIRVRHNGSLGSATTDVTIDRNAALEIDVPNFSPLAALIQLPGSIERWNREDARGATYTLPTGVNLQLNTNLNAARTIELSGGTLEGFLYADHPLAAVERTVGPAVTINLLANSFIGQANIEQGQGYDAGELPTNNQPLGNTVGGAYLRIEGNITGDFNLTKTGFDTVTLAGTGNAYGDTTVDFGILRLGVSNALPNTRSLTTRLNGTLDLFGNNQVVTGLGTHDAGINPGGTGVGSSGRITNSAPTSNTLLVNTVADYTYNGVIEQNVALVKASSGNLTLGGANTYRGNTTIVDGTLILKGSISGTPTIDVQSNATLDVQTAAGGFTVGAEQTLKGSGTVLGPSVGINGTIAPGAVAGTLTLTGVADFNTGSTLALELNGAAAYDRLVAAGANLNGPVNLTISLGYLPAPDTQFLVLENSSVNPIGGGGLFTWGGPEGLLLEGEQFDVAGMAFTITYAGGIDNNDVILTALVPEPVSGVLFLGGLALVAARRRRAAGSLS